MSLSTPGSNEEANLIQQQVIISTPVPNPEDKNGVENKQVTNVKHGNQTAMEADASKIKESSPAKTGGTRGAKQTKAAEKAEKKSKTAGAAAAAAAAQANATQQTAQVVKTQTLKTDTIEKSSSATMAMQQLVSTAVKHGFPSASIETPTLTKPKVTPRSIVQEIAAAFANSLTALNASTIQSLKNFEAIQAQASITNLATLQKQNDATKIQRQKLKEQAKISKTEATRKGLNAGQIAAIAIGVTLAVVAIVVAIFTCGAGLALEGAAAAVTASAAGAAEGAAEGAAVGAAAGAAAAEGATEGAATGAAVGAAAEGAAEGTAEGVTEGVTEGITEGVAETASQGASEGATEAAAETASDIAENAGEEGAEVSESTEQVTQQAARQAASSASKTTHLIEEGASQTAESTSEASQSVGETASTTASTSTSEDISSSAEEAVTSGIEDTTNESSSAAQEIESQATSMSSRTSNAIRNGLQKIKDIKNQASQTYKTGKDFLEGKSPRLMKVLNTLSNKWLGMATSVVLALPELASGIEGIKLSKEQQKLADLQKQEGVVSAEAQEDTMFTSFWQQASRIAAGQVGQTSQMEQSATKTFSKLAKAYRSISQGLSNSV